MMGACGLCGKYADLQASHLMPKSLYKNIKQAYPTGKGGVVIANKERGSIAYSDKQVKKHLLCRYCEGRFSRLGENTVIAECYKKKDDSYGKGVDQFKILSKLKNSKEIHEAPVDGAYNPNFIDDIEGDHYFYFALSILWRASRGGSWGSGADYSGLLGNHYEEKFKDYLLDNSKFPDNVYVYVRVDSDSEPSSSEIIFPGFKKLKYYHYHCFFIPGVQFTILVGKRIPEYIRKIYSKGDTKIYLGQYSFRESGHASSLCKYLKPLQAKGHYLKNNNKCRITDLM